ncbi:MAG: hypothetical protein K1Y01_06625 [Vicinamibacteria bacterium]|nr:hypothetical protein [Vicinamibacteria bacterium]
MRRSVKPLELVPEEVWKIRRHAALEKKRLHFSKLSGRQWTKYDAGHRAIADFAAEALRRKPSKALGTPCALRVAAMFYGAKADLAMYGGGQREEQHLRHDETVLRILLKGAAHYLFGPDDPIRVVDLVTDGQPGYRPLSSSRILHRLHAEEASGRSPLRDYVKLSDDAAIRGHATDHKNFLPGSKEDRDSQFLQLADLFLGAISRSCFDAVAPWPKHPLLGPFDGSKKDIIAHPIREVLAKAARGASFRHGGHYRTFSVGQVRFGPDAVWFSRLTPKNYDPQLPVPQLDLSWS